MALRRVNIGASRRRRRDEEGEDEGSIDGELEDDSLSEGSDVTHQDDDDADGEGSDESDDEVSTSGPGNTTNGHQVNGRRSDTNPQESGRHSSSPGKRPLATTAMSDTEAMMNGMKIADTNEVTELHFDDLKGSSGLPTGRAPSAPPTEPRRDTVADRKRREPEKGPKDRDEDPAVVPTRGSFFLHDKRSTESASNGHKSSSRTKSRPYGLIVDGTIRRNTAKPASEGVWTHDLHETVAGDDPPTVKPAPTSTFNNPPKQVPTAPRTSPPNRSLSSTTVLGNVPVVVLLPGMAQPASFQALKKQHTRLPQHRPPLRRDKPVRISLPGQAPRYIFPALERSFIFIPRALRPNQQAYRGRGRGGFYGGRRPSVYAASSYTPSVVSRRSSLGKAVPQEGYHSPAAAVVTRPAMMPTDTKPVVRLPPPRPLPAGPGMPPTAVPASLPPPPPHPVYRESRPAPIPMHQPRPQKAVSVADIETPATFPFNPPQPQQEQPFHHQVPVHANGSVHVTDTHPPSTHSSVTPLSHIPERAIHAQPFQPYGYQPIQPYYPAAYPPGGAYYPGSGAEYPAYNAGVPPYGSGQVPYVVAGAPPSTEQTSQSGTVAHEAGGTVYFYDAMQMYPGSPYGVPGTGAPGPGGVMGMGGMMTPPGAAYYYPPPQGPQGGVYYPAQ
ncbi:hypothetical protein ATEIFO6365_0010047200 [Aspergillus terreus]|uniref:Uncharacterized protein n=1 Tax=Aspergillus terreus TaxID=33178 RepID=A0A5M3ZA63_ASPTE|nr:hypothetical protein ATETN484_0012045400 [Aspergillus terreus]GFF19692.1 hypothetical protein ATEIFO6365_0010047200 [Aspergillus terreus]